ncbi:MULTISPECIES: leucine-rich repeat protein [unclassified Butyrivibrio]|uniref:leucine-rich repeat protein n=1 Tax=unclassified Butyrivibrio TaxID=2639466 RepID=UPI00041C54EE|nr:MULTISPECIES: leucine-rich repeat protein [unclassified Butyrivibrio]
MAIKYVRKVALLIFACAALLMLPVGSLGVNAGNKLPTGGLSIAPDVNNLGIFEITDEEARELDEPAVLNGFAASTGEHYKYLSSDEKTLYLALYNAISQGKYIPYNVNVSDNKDEYEQYEYVIEKTTTKTGFDPDFSDQLNCAKQALYYDYPDRIEFFMCWPVFTYGYGHIVGDKTEVSFCFILKAFYDNTQFATIDSQITQGLNSYLSYIRSNNFVSSWPAVTEQRVYDYYSEDIDYDYACAADKSVTGAFNLSHTAWGSLHEQFAVCDGYSAGFEMIMDSLGIDSMVIGGIGNGGGHAWNIVKLDGRWYEVDTTWANNGDYAKWFNRTTSQFASMSPSHIRVPNSAYSGYKMPIAYGTHYTYSYVTNTSESAMEHDPYVEVTGVSIPETTKSVLVGDTFTLTPTITPANAGNRNYFLETDDESIVALSGSTFIAMEAGTTIVRVVTDENRLSAECQVTVNPKPKDKGTTIQVKTTGNNSDSYKVTSSDGMTVSYTKAGNKNATSITIPSTVTDENGVTYTVTEIESNALKNLKKLKKLTIPATIKKIGKNALKNTTKLKTLKVYGNALATVKSGAFTGMNNNCKITIYCKNKTKYNKLVRLFKKAGAKKQKYTFKKKK